MLASIHLFSVLKIFYVVLRVVCLFTYSYFFYLFYTKWHFCVFTYSHKHVKTCCLTDCLCVSLRVSELDDGWSSTAQNDVLLLLHAQCVAWIYSKITGCRNISMESDSELTKQHATCSPLTAKHCLCLELTC